MCGAATLGSCPECVWRRQHVYVQSHNGVQRVLDDAGARRQAW